MRSTLTSVIVSALSAVALALAFPKAGQAWLAPLAAAGLFWVPVIFMQIEMRDLAHKAAAQNEPLPPRYFALFRRWFLFGFPGFGSVMAILWLMIAKPY